MSNIISVSRRTDIPAFYGDWFINRLNEGLAGYVNPFGGQKYIVSLKPENVSCFVFWSKNFQPFIEKLKTMEAMGYKRFYFHFTITGLPNIFESNLTETEYAIATLKELSRMYSPKHVNWRYDPIVISSITGADFHLKNFENIASRLKGHVERCYFSYPYLYKKVKRNIDKFQKEKSITIYDPDNDFKLNLAQQLADIADRYDMSMNSCGNKDLVGGKIKQAHCVDGDIIGELFFNNDFKYVIKPSREGCGCAESTDIGAYDTCPHGCIYCYANVNKEKASTIFENHEVESAFLGHSKSDSDKWISDINARKSGLCYPRNYVLEDESLRDKPRVKEIIENCRGAQKLTKDEAVSKLSGLSAPKRYALGKQTLYIKEIKRSSVHFFSIPKGAIENPQLIINHGMICPHFCQYCYWQKDLYSSSMISVHANPKEDFVEDIKIASIIWRAFSPLISSDICKDKVSDSLFLRLDRKIRKKGISSDDKALKSVCLDFVKGLMEDWKIPKKEQKFILSRIKNPAYKPKVIFDSGENNDSVALEHITNIQNDILIPTILNMDNAYLILRTKSIYFGFLEKLNKHPKRDHIIISPSINPRYLIEKYEPGNHSLEDRLESLRAAAIMGFKVFLCFSPMIYERGSWRKLYAEFVKEVKRYLPPEKVHYYTVGSLRLSKQALRNIKNIHPGTPLDSPYFIPPGNTSGDKFRYSGDIRRTMYAFLIREMNKAGYDKVPRYLQTETIELWQSLMTDQYKDLNLDLDAYRSGRMELRALTEPSLPDKERREVDDNHRGLNQDVRLQKTKRPVQRGVGNELEQIRTKPKKTKDGRPFDFFVQEEVKKGNLRLERIPRDILGTPRDLEIYRAIRKTNLIVNWTNEAEDKAYCREYWADLKIGKGPCGYRCPDCFLTLTHRVKADPSRHILYENREDFIKAVIKWLLKPSLRQTLGLGTDCSDSLLYEGVTGYARALIPLFADPKTNPSHRHLLLLTKSANVDYLKGLPAKNVIVSFSLNPQEVADIFEGYFPDGLKITPSINTRIEASLKCERMGFETRWRIDPIIPIDNWQDTYRGFFEESSRCRPQRITLGIYRQMGPGLKEFSKKWGIQPMPWESPVPLEKDAGLHFQLPRGMRIDIYKEIKKMVEDVWANDERPELALCKEVSEVRSASGITSKHCNCE